MRLDILTSDWHKLIKPVLPHAGADKETPWLSRVRLELGARALYAVATDRCTLAVERHQLSAAEMFGDWPPVDIEAAEAKASLALLTYDKDYDGGLEVTVSKAPVPLAAGHSVMSWAVTVHRPDDGLRLQLRDRRDPNRSVGDWRKGLLAALTRPRGRSLDGLDLSGRMLARWAAAARGAEQLRFWTGPRAGDPLLVTVEDHFAGIWATGQHLDDDARDRSALPWAAELLPEGITPDGEKDGDG